MNSKALGYAALVLFFSSIFFPVLKIGNLGFNSVYIIRHWSEFTANENGEGMQYLLIGVATMYLALVAGILAVIYDHWKNARGIYLIAVLSGLISIVAFHMGYSEYLKAMVSSQGARSLGSFVYLLMGPGDGILLEALGATLATLAYGARECREA